MSDAAASPPFSPDPSALVTASDLVRRFGIWQDRAARAPVYVLHRGRPRLVLASIDLMEALCAPHANDADDVTLEQLLGALASNVVLLDSAGRIAALSRGARASFGVAAAPGAAWSAIWNDRHRFLARAIERAATAGRSDVLEVADPRRSGRRCSVVVEPLGEHVLLAITDVTDEDRARALAAEQQALEAAGTAVGQVATARINLRGYLDAPGEMLAALTGVSPDALAAVRFVTLLDVASRVPVGDAIEAAIAGEDPPPTEALLLAARGSARPVTIALAPIHGRAAVVAVLAVIVARPNL